MTYTEGLATLGEIIIILAGFAWGYYSMSGKSKEEQKKIMKENSKMLIAGFILGIIIVILFLVLIVILQ